MEEEKSVSSSIRDPVRDFSEEGLKPAQVAAKMGEPAKSSILRCADAPSMAMSALKIAEQDII